MFKWTKRIVLTTAVAGGLGALCFGTNLISYVRSSGRMLTSTVKDAIPVEFEIQRARDHLEDLVPEMHANLRLVAAEEVEVANLEQEIVKEARAIEGERKRLQGLRRSLDAQHVSYTFGSREYTRAEVVDELARRFEHLQSAEKLMEGKKGLLRNRQRSLDAAVGKLERTRLARLGLATQIEALEGQFRLVQAQAGGGEFQIDASQLARTERIISELKKRLDVAQRVLARKARFVEMIPVEDVSESRVVERIDSYFGKNPGSVAQAPAEGAEY